ncbi:alkaline phosphatase family protein [Elizabethkingia meningoseptica]|uniref:alkaline phosphatase PafA n=1 Tax=Elizabethkingia meningoseptica TaxID=238 RepID=UPI0023AECFE3|nr:alkaline phosphatase PafA [Elizabethkingia meningoseptica]MDE5439115.1 alkaline phosphatase family protein [Elizabethkingia meningoseptica]MDE5509326.1 alkaline phosphatase family protein [Elizabethkingia meningoseptica]MDE5516757.1 alkaline phosphatase family protein [Elizabethkingia meningoseptica]MDE5527456.1 alkaline phosphatase family protein [Elizabethkingia meningoseptica]MDE5530996.1 alkaline phosphatase family protein [Elizabethkingia meningoseptica]
MLTPKKWLLGVLVVSGMLGAQKTNDVPRPKLVVGLVVDQMRWDYLYRYYSKYGEGGFKRLLNTGYSLNNVHIDYVPTVTAIGHTSIFTGSVPSIHGIAGNDWYDKEKGKSVYCTADETVQPVGTTSNSAGQHSPRNLWSTTVTDQLGLATNFTSKVVGVSLKDRASILPAGHNPTGAYWFDDTSGKFITSTYYTKELPKWVDDFNNRNIPAQLVANGWNTLLPISQYTESSADNVAWEGLLGSKKTPTFPYTDLAKDYEAKKGLIRTTPFGNTLTLQMAEAAIDGNQMGADNITDFLTVNLASTDYVGHNFGPNSIEVEDTYLRLDRDFEAFFKNLDKKVGKGNYLVFLSADHGAAHSVGFMEANKMPTGFFVEDMKKDMNAKLKQKFGADNIIAAAMNYQVYLDRKVLADNKISLDDARDFVIEELKKEPSVLYAINMEEISEASVPEPIKSRIINGYNWKRSGDIQMVSKDGYLSAYSKKGTTHSVWNSYDSHIPLIFMGWGIKQGESNQSYHMTDIAPTVSALLKIQFPSGAVGKPITEVIGR